MAVLILLRHGRSTANADGTLAGWTPGVSLDDRGFEQATRVGARLAATPLAAVVSSPLQRCQQTAAAVAAAQPRLGGVQTEERIGECHYGSWTGRTLQELSQEPLWRDIQDHPSSVTFPAHDDFRSESVSQMQDRAVHAISHWDARIEAEHGPGAVWVAVSHGDVIKALVAHAVGTPLDQFQRIVIDPASLSVIRHATDRPFVLRLNDTGSDPVDLRGLARALSRDASDGRGGSPDDAAVGGGAGSD